MSKMKVVTVVGTRPEIIRLSRVLAKLDEYCDHHLVHTGQNHDYELNEIFFEDLGVRRASTSQTPRWLPLPWQSIARSENNSCLEGPACIEWA